MQPEQDPSLTPSFFSLNNPIDFIRQKVNWVDLEEDSEEEKVEHKDIMKPEVKKPATTMKAPKEKKPVNAATKEKHTGKNVYACEDLDFDEGNDKETGLEEKNVRKDNALSDLLSN